MRRVGSVDVPQEVFHALVRVRGPDSLSSASCWSTRRRAKAHAPRGLRRRAPGGVPRPDAHLNLLPTCFASARAFRMDPACFILFCFTVL